MEETNVPTIWQWKPAGWSCRDSCAGNQRCPKGCDSPWCASSITRDSAWSPQQYCPLDAIPCDMDPRMVAEQSSQVRTYSYLSEVSTQLTTNFRGPQIECSDWTNRQNHQPQGTHRRKEKSSRLWARLALEPSRLHNINSTQPLGDIEGHLGTDGKYYLLDFARTMPPEAPDWGWVAISSRLGRSDK